MDSSSNSEIITQLLEAPGYAFLRKFGSLGYTLLLRLQSELTAIELHNGETLKAHVDLRETGATQVLGPEVSTEDRQLEDELHRKLIDYYMLLHLFSKVQSSRTPHAIVLENLNKFLERKFHIDIKHTQWSNKTDLMGPFTNYLPEHKLITMSIVSFLHKMRGSRWVGGFIDIMPNCIRRRIEHVHFDRAWVLETEGISKWFSELVVIIVPTIIVAPMFALYAIPSTWDRMACLWGFAIIFAFMTKLLASQSSEIIFATNAAFCAVLVVFVGTALPA